MGRAGDRPRANACTSRLGVGVACGARSAGLTLQPAGSELDAARFGSLRRHIVVAYELPGRSAMLVVLFDRPEPLAPKRVGMSGDRTVNEAAGRVDVEYDSAHLARPAAVRVRHAFRHLV